MSLAPPDTPKSHLPPPPDTRHPSLPVGFVLTPLWAFSCFLLLLVGIFLSIVAIATSNTGPKQREELFARTAAGDIYLGWGGGDGSVTAVTPIAQMGKLRQKQVTLGEAGGGVGATGTTEMG